MNFDELEKTLLSRVAESDQPRLVLKSAEFGKLYGEIKNQPPEDRASFGQKVNELKTKVEQAINDREALAHVDNRTPIDVTAPMDVNAVQPELLPSEKGSQHPLTREMRVLESIFERMGFVIED